MATAAAAAELYRDRMLIPAENIINYTFRDDSLLLEALQAAGSTLQHLYPEGNKRLAMIGDAVIKLALLEDLRETDTSRSRCYQ